MAKYRYITDVNPDFFILGGLVYHHQEIIDPEERDKEFQKRISKNNKINNKQSEYNKNYFEIEEQPLTIDNIYSLKAEINNIKNSQSLSEMAMNNVMVYFGEDTMQHPFEEMHEKNDIPSANIWVRNGIKIIDSDIIIFISHKGTAGNIYDHSIQKQKLCIRYSEDDKLGIYVGEVFDYNLVFDYLSYSEYMEEILDNEVKND